MTRLTDEELAGIAKLARGRGDLYEQMSIELVELRAEREDCYVAASEPAWGGPLEESAVAAIRKTLPTTGALMRKATAELRHAREELRQSRAAALTGFDRMVVEVWRDRLEADETVDRHFIALLDRLLAKGAV